MLMVMVISLQLTEVETSTRKKETYRNIKQLIC
jgi:hypothetical protein